MVINSRLTWGDHVGLICTRVYGSLYPLRRMANATPVWLRRRFVLVLLLPHFLNGEVVYYGLDRVSLHRLLVAFNACIRYVYGLGHRDHVSERIVEVLGLSLPNYLKDRYLRFVHRVLIPRTLTEIGRSFNVQEIYSLIINSFLLFWLRALLRIN